MPGNERTLLLLDVDGTLSEHQRPVGRDMINTLAALRRAASVDIAVVSGSDIGKILSQFQQPDVHNLLSKPSLHPSEKESGFLSYVFSENGLVSYSSHEGLRHTQSHLKNIIGTENISVPGKVNSPFNKNINYVELCRMSLIEYLGEERYQTLVNYILTRFAAITLPKKRSNMIELRTGVLNVSPLGRTCTIKEREEFYVYDKMHKIRETLCHDLSEHFKEYGLQFSCGGQISIDIYPDGWDKTFCLSLLNLECYSAIYFFGDRCVPGGNDYTIYCDKRITHPVSVSGPNETLRELRGLCKRLEPSATNNSNNGVQNGLSELKNGTIEFKGMRGESHESTA